MLLMNELLTLMCLQILATKIYAIRVNSMPEERTVSTFTWLTPALSAAKRVGTIGDQTLIRQYYATETKVMFTSP